ncbi:MAG: hypothetical protein HYV03_04010 [Deltaproteobacteria bacterium]|nr:hypothetical protein [Deltaproteobacteria bacterium]
MSATHFETADQLPAVRPLTVRGGFRLFCIALAVIGGVTFFASLKANPERAFANYLLGFFYWTSLSLSGVFFLALQYITGSTWSITLRRIPEALVAFLPVAVVLFFGVLAGSHHLYEWAHPQAMDVHGILQKKAAYLNLPFFTFRNLSCLLIWLVFGWLLVRNSIRQDETGAVSLTKRNTKLAAAFLLIFALTYTFFSVDLLMSLEAEWYSTIFGVYCFAGLFLSGIAMITVIAVILYRRKKFGPYVHPDHLYDLGKLMLAFTVFWAYIAFSQFMLIWYADLPEETFYLSKRMIGPWQPMAWALLIVKFIIPFCLLLPQGVKRQGGYLFGIACWVLAAHYLDCYWLVIPRFAERGPIFGMPEIGIFVGFAGLFGLAVSTFLGRVPIVPRRDPRIMESVNFHQ